MLHMGSLRVHHTHGGRGTPVLFIHGLGSFTRFIERYMEGRGLRSAAVVGASLGGRVALELALKHPQRVSKLVLVNSLGLGRPTLRLTYGLMTLPRVGETVMQVARNALNWVPAPMIRRLAGPYTGMSADLDRTRDDSYLDNLRELYAADGYHDAYLATVRSLVTPSALFGNGYDVSARLPEIKVPLQLIWGADDPLFPLVHATRAHALVDDSRLAVIEGAGHTPQAERPEEFNRVLLDFLSA